MKRRIQIVVAVVAVAILATGAWLWATAGRESTDDAQVDAHVTPIAARVGGTVLTVPVGDNQLVEAGTILVEIDPRDYEVALQRAQAELADAEAAAEAANVAVPITTTTGRSNESVAQGGVEQAQAGLRSAQTAPEQITATRARAAAAAARVQQRAAMALASASASSALALPTAIW